MKKYIADVVNALQIAGASAFYSQLVWLSVESVANEQIKKAKLFDFLKLFFVDKAGHLHENCMIHVNLLFYVNNFHV